MGASSMGAAQPIRGLFASDISRNIEEVIKVDQRDEEIIRDEIRRVRRHGLHPQAVHGDPRRVRRDAQPAPRGDRHLGLRVLRLRQVAASPSCSATRSRTSPSLGIPAGKRFAEHVGDAGLSVLLDQDRRAIPTHAVIFDVATDRGIRSGNQTLTEITYRLFLESLGYARDLDVSELEIELEAEGRLEDFEAAYRKHLRAGVVRRARRERRSPSSRRAGSCTSSTPRRTRSAESWAIVQPGQGGRHAPGCWRSGPRS